MHGCNTQVGMSSEGKSAPSSRALTAVRLGLMLCCTHGWRSTSLTVARCAGSGCSIMRSRSVHSADTYRRRGLSHGRGTDAQARRQGTGQAAVTQGAASMMCARIC